MMNGDPERRHSPCVSGCVLCPPRPSLSEQELFSGPLGGLDSGFNSVDSGSKRWSGNEVRKQVSFPLPGEQAPVCWTDGPLISDFRVSQSADDSSERSRERERRSLEEEQDDASPRTSKRCTFCLPVWKIQLPFSSLKGNLDAS